MIGGPNLIDQCQCIGVNSFVFHISQAQCSLSFLGLVGAICMNVQWSSTMLVSEEQCVIIIGVMKMQK